jgi:hypothetical protein
VRILVDGRRAAEMPHPKPSSPYREVTFQLGEHTLVAVAYLSREPETPQSPGLDCDLFNDGQSLSGGPSLAQTQHDAPHPGDVYPGAFRLVDMVLYFTPAAAAPGMFVGLGNASTKLDWSARQPSGLCCLAHSPSPWRSRDTRGRASEPMRRDPLVGELRLAGPSSSRCMVSRSLAGPWSPSRSGRRPLGDPAVGPVAAGPWGRWRRGRGAGGGGAVGPMAAIASDRGRRQSTDRSGTRIGAAVCSDSCQMHARCALGRWNHASGRSMRMDMQGMRPRAARSALMAAWSYRPA